MNRQQYFYGHTHSIPRLQPSCQRGRAVILNEPSCAMLQVNLYEAAKAEPDSLVCRKRDLRSSPIVWADLRSNSCLLSGRVSESMSSNVRDGGGTKVEMLRNCISQSLCIFYYIQYSIRHAAARIINQYRFFKFVSLRRFHSYRFF